MIIHCLDNNELYTQINPLIPHTGWLASEMADIFAIFSNSAFGYAEHIVQTKV